MISITKDLYQKMMMILRQLKCIEAKGKVNGECKNVVRSLIF